MRIKTDYKRNITEEQKDKIPTISRIFKLGIGDTKSLISLLPKEGKIKKARDSKSAYLKISPSCILIIP